MKIKTDFVGMALSIGCIIHCLLLPIVLPLLPMIGFAVDHDSHFHIILSAIITLVAIIALVPGYTKHHFIIPLFLATIGIFFIVGAGVLESSYHDYKITLVTVFGSLLITTAHYINHRCLCSCEHHECGN